MATAPAKTDDPKADDQAGKETTTPEPSKETTTASEVDLTKLSEDQLTKVLENPALFKTPRIAGLLEKAARADELEKAQQTAKEKTLEAEKKFEELSIERGTKVEQLEKQLEDTKINQALISKLSTENVVDLEGALTLANRSSVKVEKDGSVSGVDEAVDSLKKDKSYLFNKPGTTVGSPTGQPAEAGGPAKFKRSQLTPEFMKEHREEVYKAMDAGLIEDDGPAQ